MPVSVRIYETFLFFYRIKGFAEYEYLRKSAKNGEIHEVLLQFMRTNIFYFSTVFALLMLVACAKDDKSATQYAAMTGIQPTIASGDCGKEAHHICNQGLSFVKIGDSLAGLSFTDASIKGVKDTALSTQDYTAFGKIISLNEGTIMIESTPIENGETDNDLTHAHVGTIRIQSTLFSTAENIKVGSTFAQLKALYPDSLMVVEPGDAAGEIELKVPKVTRINYTLQQKSTVQTNPGAEIYEVSDIAADAKVSAIMIMQ